MHKVLQSYLRRLTNLSGNNRSLLLLRLISDQFLDLHDFDFLKNKSSFSIIEDLMARKTKINVASITDSRDDKNNEVSAKIKKIQRIDRFIFEERGSKDLYIGWPFVRGKLNDGTLIRCPLLFFPVSIELEQNEWYIHARPDVNITFNKSFLLAYSYFNQLSLDETLIEHTFEDFDKDSRVFRTDLYQMLKDSPVELNFNQENFLDHLVPFENFKKADFSEKQGTGELKLFPEAVLGIFPQAGSYLVPDYLKMLENEQIEDIEAFFSSRSPDDQNDEENNHSGYFNFLNKIKEEKTFTPFAIDAYQENALKAIKRGNSLVIQGPPGTGKSQLICNLIADFMAAGKKVLVVCQKRVALDVVYDRLDQQDFSDFVGLVHDFKNDRKRIYEKISRQIDNIYEYKLKNNSLDAIQLERKFLQVSRKIDQITEELEELKFALFDDTECGVSVKELYLTCDFRAPSVHLKQEYKYFDFEKVEEFLPKLKIFTAYANKFNKEDYPWHNRVRFRNYSISDLQRMRTIIEEIPKFQENFAKRAEPLINAKIGLEGFEAIYSKREKIKELLRHLQNKDVYRYFAHMVNFQDKETDFLWLGTMERVIMECFKGPGPEKSLASQELGPFQEAVHKRLQARKGLIKFIRWNLFSKDKAYIKKVMQANDLTPSRKNFRLLVEKIDNRLNLEHNITKLKSKKSLIEIPTSYDIDVFTEWINNQKKAVMAKLIFSSLRNFKEYFNVQKIDYEELKNILEKLLRLIQEIPIKKNSWLIYMTPQQIHNILEDEDYANQLLETLEADFDALCDFDNLSEGLEGYEVSTIKKLLDETTDYENAQVEELFQNSIRLSWIEHIETKFPILRSVSSLKFERMQQEYQESVHEKMKISAQIALLKCREKVYEDLEYNRLNNLVTYRDLNHQVNKKKKIWPLRKLIASYYEELFNLIPCWMASPESVSAIFPMQQMFDLVIFDEASQCFVERGIPAMYRGKQVVVAGDDKQLSPYDLYKVRWEEEDTDDPLLEIDSLLDLSSQYLMQVQLRGHYRSQSLDLIDFSNQNFYNGKLKLLPDHQILNMNEPAIDYIKVDGIWQDNVNETEAQKVVELVFQLIEKDPTREIGIVTFNVKQQGLIVDLLEEKASAEAKVIPDSLIIKNIENVQGDEKDVIIFSTGYAPDPKGKMIMQFGSLNAIKGENRLNVAITRARKKIFIVSSIYPHELKVEDAKNEGPKLLKAYLNYALEVSQGNFKPEIHTKMHRANWYLKNRVKEMLSDGDFGFELAEDMPFADLSVRENGDYLGLILTDDELYHQSISVKESHVYLPDTMTRKNWPYREFFSREFWHDKEVLKERIIRFIKNIE